MKRRLKQILEWSHGGILLSVLAPILYGLAIQDEAGYYMERVWLLNLLILFVVVGTDLFMARCRKLSVYLIVSVLCVMVVNLAAWKLHGFAGAGDSMDIGIGVTVILALESMIVFVERILIRLHNKKSADRQEKNPDWRPRQSVLTHPQAIYVSVLVFAYGVGKYCNNPPLCNISMALIPVYLCIALSYSYLEGTEDYLFLNRRVCNLSQRRLYGISGSICLVFLLGILCMGILSVATASYRNYKDIRGLFKGQVDTFGAPPVQSGEEAFDFFGWVDEMPYVLDMKVKKPPVWMKTLEKGLAVTAVIIVVLLGIYGLRRIGRLFRETFDENGDVVENLDEKKEVAERVKPVRTAGGHLTEAERIRRQYRRTIRRYRKNQPGRHETPYEIESGAGIADTEEGQSLHRAYEQVRYLERGN